MSDSSSYAVSQRLTGQYRVELGAYMAVRLGSAITYLRRLCVLHTHTNHCDAKAVLNSKRCGLRLHLITRSCRVGRRAAWCIQRGEHGSVKRARCQVLDFVNGRILSLPSNWRHCKPLMHVRRPQSALGQCVSELEVQCNLSVVPNRWS